MQTYMVIHRKDGRRFFVLAASSSEAIERVAMNLEDAEGQSAWSAEPDSKYNPSMGVVLDASGKPVMSLEA